MYKYLIFSSDHQIGLLQLNRPPVNALCNDMVDELDQMVSDIDQETSLRALVITGVGEKSFMAGADITELKERDFILGRLQSKRRQDVFTRLAELRVPTIAAVNGFALGAGLELALSCSIRIASDNAKFGCPEVGLGIIPGDGATQRLPRIIGMGRAMHMI
ncbi:MAG: enoyl-CoA hydratase-related protein, partial [Betaproteobacteria bacterium]